MKTKYLTVSLLALTVATTDAFGANGDVILTVYGNALNAARYGATVGYVDLSNYVTVSQLSSELSDFGEMMFAKSEEVTNAKKAAEEAAAAVASKVDESDLRRVAFTGMASDLNNDIGWIDQESAWHLITSYTNTATEDMATKTWANSNFADKDWVQSELDDVGNGMVELARMTNAATLAANTATDAIASKANATDVFTKTESDERYASKTVIDTKLDNLDTLIGTATTGITTLGNSVNALSTTVSTKADAADVYTRDEMDATLANYITSDQIDARLGTYVESGDLATVAFSGNSSDLNNDAGFITSAALSDYTTTADLTTLLSSKADANDVYSKSEIDSTFATKSSVDDINSELSRLSTAYENVTGTSTEMQAAIEGAQRTADDAATRAANAQAKADYTEQLYVAAVEFLVDMNNDLTNLTKTVDNKANTNDLSDVAFSGKSSDLINDANFIDDAALNTALSDYTTTSDLSSLLADKADASAVYTKDQVDAKTDAITAQLSDYAKTTDLDSLAAQIQSLNTAVENAGNDYTAAMESAHDAATIAELASTIASGATLTANAAATDAAAAKTLAQNANDSIAELSANVYDKTAVDDKFNALVDGELANINTSLAELTSNASSALAGLETKANAADVYSKSDMDTKLSAINDDIANTTAGAIAQLSDTMDEMLDTKVDKTALATVATSGNSSDLNNDAGFITKDVADLANYTTTEVLNNMMADKVSIDQISELFSGVANTATISLAAVNNVDSNCTVANAIQSLDKTIGAAISSEHNGVSSTNSVNENIMAMNNTIGDTGIMRNGNAITKGTYTMPETVVSAINNIDETIGKIHGLFDGTHVDATNVASTTGTGSNLAIGTTVEDHLVTLDNAIGNRNITSANASINAAAAVSVSDALSVTGDLIGTMDFSGTNYLGGVTNITDALRTLDANIATGMSGGAASVAMINQIENKIDHVENKLNKGMAAMSALTALVPNARASGRTQLSVGTGTYGDKVGIAAGAFHYVNNRVLVNAGASYGGSGDMAFRAGITFGW